MTQRRAAVLIPVMVAALAQPGGAALAQRAGAAPGPATAPASAPPGPQVRPGTVTLITGDRVSVVAGPGAGPGVRVQPGPGRRHILFQTLTGGRHLRVIPSDAAGPLARKRLDDRLFDISYLLREGYGDAQTREVPLIVDRAGRRSAGRLAGGRVTATLASIGASVVRVRKSTATRFWDSLRAEADPGKVWLDGKVRATLDKSVPQIGAPAAWKAGLTGKGVTAAVLDTGYDTTHPDLKGVVKTAKDFTRSRSGVQDKFGHGTHVASIMAGRGTASHGRYTGVAKGARLAAGKVLNDSGGGLDSWVIAGMEWAVKTAHARVVNVSLGGYDTPEVDPVEAAVERLTRQTGALFVVAAGNSGPAPETIDSPGSAGAALTVAAVDGKDRLADFSSRGPNPGDRELKPDIAAPGVDIAAARAKGSGLGRPVGTAYQRLSGTSMATPHVAGAAAILLQQHPGWQAARLKSTLMGTAKPLGNASSYSVGTGRLELARAIRTQLSASAPSLSFGYLKWPNTNAPPARKVVTYRNDGIQAVTLSLRAQSLDANGKPSPSGLFRLDRPQLTVPAKGTASVAVTMTPGGAPPGVFGGWLTAASADGKASVRTALGVYKEPESYDLTIKTLDHEGKPPAARADLNQWTIASLDDPDASVYFGVSGDTVRLRPGRYGVFGYVSTARAGQPYPAVVALSHPELGLKKDTTVTLDGRSARRVQVSVDRPTARATWSLKSLIKAPPSTGVTYFVSTLGLAHGMEAYAGAAFASPQFAFATQARFQEPEIRLDVTAPQVFPVDVWYAEPRGDGDKAPKLLGMHRMDAVLGGKGTPGELRGARGKLVILSLTPKEDAKIPERVRNVKNAGGLAVLLARQEWPRFTGDLALPLLATNHPDGGRLVKLAGAGKVSVTTRGVTVSPYQYNLFYPAEKQVADRPIYHARTQDLGAVRVTYRGTGGRQIANLSTAVLHFGRWLDDGWSQLIPAPTTRTEYFSPGRVRFTRSIGGYWGGWPTVQTVPRSYRPGEQVSEIVHKGVIGPSFTPGPWEEDGRSRPAWAYRGGERVDVMIPLFSGTDPGQVGLASDFDDRVTGSTVLYRNGTQVGRTKEPGAGRFTVPAAAARYRLDAEGTCHLSDWRVSTTVKSSWTFNSGHTGKATALPLIGVRYLPRLDDYNRAPAGRPFSFGVRVDREPGSSQAPLKSLAVQASYDDGKTWTPVTLKAEGGQWTATVRNPAKGHVSLRAIGQDAQGTTVNQTIMRAYVVSG